MKALSVKDPYAELIKTKKKTIETRTWNTTYRGKILIVCSKIPKTPNSGLAIAVTEIVDCRPMRKDSPMEEFKAQCPWYIKAKAWILKNTRAIKPFPVKGQLNIYNVDIDESELVYLD